MGSCGDQVEIMGSVIVNNCIDAGVIGSEIHPNQDVNNMKLRDNLQQATNEFPSDHAFNRTRRRFEMNAVVILVYKTPS